MNPQTLGQRIKAARMAAGLTTQARLAEACGWENASRVGNYEQDTREPSLEDLRRIAKAVEPSGYSYAWLVLGPEAIGSSGSQPARLDPDTIVLTTRALLAFLRRRNPAATLDLTQAGDAALFAEVYAMAASLDDEFELGAAVADFMAAREAKNGGESESIAGADGSKARRATARR